MKKTSNASASQRSVKESIVTPVINFQTPAQEGPQQQDKKEDKRSDFTVAKQRTLDLYKKVKWLVPEFPACEFSNEEKVDKIFSDGSKVPFATWSKWPMYQLPNANQHLFKSCLLHVLDEMEDYNIFAFRKDLVRRMSLYINSRSFERDCRRGNWSMFRLAQRIAWAKQRDQDKILYEGLACVPGFEARGIDVFNFDELWPDFSVLGFDKKDFEGDPFIMDGETYWKKYHQQDAKAEEEKSNAA